MGILQRPCDTNQLARHIVALATGEVEEETRPKAPGQRKSGLKGGVSRAQFPDSVRSDFMPWRHFLERLWAGELLDR